MLFIFPVRLHFPQQFKVGYGLAVSQHSATGILFLIGGNQDTFHPPPLHALEGRGVTLPPRIPAPSVPHKGRELFSLSYGSPSYDVFIPKFAYRIVLKPKMIFFITKVSDRSGLRFFIHFYNRDIVYVKIVNQILALRSDNDLRVYGQIFAIIFISSFNEVSRLH